MFDLPKIRIEVETMMYAIIHAFSAHNDEIEKAVETELAKAIAEYPFEQQIRRETFAIIGQAINRSIEEFFKYGEGYQMINEVVTKAIKESIAKNETK